MANIKFTNFARTALAVGVGSGDVTMSVTGGTGALFPALTAGQYFYATLENATLDREIVKVTARSTDTLTVTRGQDNTTARAWVAGDIVSLRLNAAAIEEAVVGTLLGANNLSDVASAATSRANLGLAIGSDVQPYDVDTAKTDVVQTFSAAQRGAVIALTDSATITVDMNLGNFYAVTLAGNRTLANPTNLTPGQSGAVFITQDGTGGRTLAYGTNWDFEGGVAPILSAGAGKVDRLDFLVRTASSIHAVLSKDWS